MEQSRMSVGASFWLSVRGNPRYHARQTLSNNGEHCWEGNGKVKAGETELRLRRPEGKRADGWNEDRKTGDYFFFISSLKEIDKFALDGSLSVYFFRERLLCLDEWIQEYVGIHQFHFFIQNEMSTNTCHFVLTDTEHLIRPSDMIELLFY